MESVYFMVVNGLDIGRLFRERHVEWIMVVPERESQPISGVDGTPRYQTERKRACDMVGGWYGFHWTSGIILYHGEVVINRCCSGP
jgi:hypothetical protein